MRKALLLAALAVSSAVHAAPPPVLGDAVVPNPGQLLDSVAAYANAVKPGSGQAVAQGRGFLDQAGVDGTAPIYLLVFDPKVGGGEPLAFVFKEKNAGQVDTAAQGMNLAVRRVGKVVLAAKKPLLDKIPDAVVTELVGRPLPGRPTAHAYMPRVYAAFKADLEAMEKNAAGGLMGDTVGAMMKMLWGFLRDTQSLDLEVDLSAAQAHLFVTMIGKPGSVLAKLGGSAKPSDFRLVAPVSGSPMVAAGSVDLTAMGNLWETMAEMSAKMVGADPKALAKAWRAYATLFSGETAYGMSMKSPTDMRIVILAEVKDPAAAVAAWELSMSAMATGKKPWFKVERAKGAFKDGAVVADEISLVPTENFPAVAAATGGTRIGIAAVVGNQLVAVQASTVADARAAMKDALASVRKPPAVPAALGAAFADARSRKESIAFFVDPAMFAALMGKKVTPGASLFGFGASGVPNGLRIRLTAPSATVKSLVSGQ